jgi:hypothetical protein
MDHLKHDLAAMITHCKQLPPNPNREQLENKVKALSSGLEKDTITIPIRVKEIISNSFTIHLGWDWMRKVVITNSLFVAANLVKTFESILEECANWSPLIQPTPEELSSLSLACSRLWELDANRLIPDKDYELNVQDGKFIFDQGTG